MVTGFLLGLGINGAYDLIKSSVVSLLGGGENSQIIESINICIECSAKEFFERFGDKYGKLSDSFLARQENYDVIVKHMFYSEQSLLKDKINKLGYNNIAIDDEDIDYFIQCLLNEMKNNFNLNKIISEKGNIKKIDEIHDKMFKSQTDNKNDKSNYTVEYSNGEQIPFEKGNIYHKKFDNGSEQKIMIDESGYHVGMKDIYNRVSYVDGNFDGRVNNAKLPYELFEYELVIPKEQVIKQSQYTIQNGYIIVYCTLQYKMSEISKK